MSGISPTVNPCSLRTFLVCALSLTFTPSTLLAGDVSWIARGENGMVAADSRDASRAGLEILRAGGNAIDAAVAVSFALGVTRSYSTGPGGGGFMIARFADGRVVVQDFRETAPHGTKPIKCPNGKVVVSKGIPVTVNGRGNGSTLGALVPDKLHLLGVSFKSACNTHERCYSDCGKSKAFCDEQLFEDAKIQCWKKFGWMHAFKPWPLELKAKYLVCASIAKVYETAVRRLGENAHTSAQKHHCKCACKPNA